MDFKDAELQMDAGKKVRRASFPEGYEGYKTPVAIKGGVVEFRFNRPGDMNSTWEPTDEDRAATDWEVISEENQVPPPAPEPELPQSPTGPDGEN